MQIRDRIQELRRVRAADLRPSPKNWRRHPETQQNALRGLLAEIGYAEALVARMLPGGTPDDQSGGGGSTPTPALLEEGPR